MFPAPFIMQKMAKVSEKTLVSEKKKRIEYIIYSIIK